MRSLLILACSVVLLCMPWTSLAETNVYKGDQQFSSIQNVCEGKVYGQWCVNKFGAAPSGIQITATDIWDQADATPTQQIWLAPTAARIHAIVSTSANDDGSPAGTGANTIRIYGLTSWTETSEAYEDVELNGQTPVNTVNNYVIIHRMKVLTAGSGGTNAGKITATAATDSTITAAINIGNGQTEMAIYGVPSGKSAYIHRWGVNIDKAAVTAVTADFRMMVNETPVANLKLFLRKDDISVQSTGTNQFDRHYTVPYRIAGPAIIKIQAIGSAADIDGESSLDIIVK